MNKLLIITVFIPFSLFSQGIQSYEENLSHYKKLVSHINSYFKDTTIKSHEISNYFSENFVFYSYPANHKKGVETNKLDYIKNFQNMRNKNLSISIGHSIYLPGLDQESLEYDGSVRAYFGSTISIDTDSVEFSGYRTINFISGKISAIWEWADYGGVNNQLNKFIEASLNEEDFLDPELLYKHKNNIPIGH